MPPDQENAPAPAEAPTPKPQDRFEAIFSKVKARGIELREKIFQAVENGEFSTIEPMATELLSLDFVAKNAQLAHAAAVDAESRAAKARMK